MRRTTPLLVPAILVLTGTLGFHGSTGVATPRPVAYSETHYDTLAPAPITPGQAACANPSYKLHGWRLPANHSEEAFSVNVAGAPAELDLAAVRRDIETSFTAWNITLTDCAHADTSPLRFVSAGATTRAPASGDGYNDVGFTAQGACAPSCVLAYVTTQVVNGQVVEWDVFINSDAPYQVDGGALTNRIDLMNVMTHEVGHIVGVAHPNAPSSACDAKNAVHQHLTMYACSSYGEVQKRTLGLGDIRGMEAIYGGSVTQ